ncbi:MAG: alpha/beta hydrolase family protein [Acutalibacteraceae bacterium]|jgi:dienelactone hydrolase
MHTVTVTREILTDRGIPVIVAAPDGVTGAPLALVNHGTTGKAEDMQGMAERLAQNGCFAVSVDAVWHGRRRDPLLDEMLTGDNYKGLYLRMLLEMADDISALIDHYAADGRVDTSRVGITGTSQGGYVSFMTMVKEPRITVAAPMIGSPDLTDKYGQSPDWDTIPEDVQKRVLADNPLARFERMAHVKLLVQNGDADTIVPVTGVRRLNEKIAPLYADRPQDYGYIEYPGRGHETPDEMQERVIAWLTEKLQAQ